MKDNFQSALARVLRHEGGWANHPKDPGGATMKGVTLETFRRYYGQARTKRDLRRITAAQLAHIYRNGYWVPMRCDDLPAGVDYAAFDAAVNSGVRRASLWLQEAAWARMDGSVGPATLAAVSHDNPRNLVLRMDQLRMKFLRGLKTWPTFGAGWTQRVQEVYVAAVQMADAGAVGEA